MSDFSLETGCPISPGKFLCKIKSQKGTIKVYFEMVNNFVFLSRGSIPYCRMNWCCQH